MRSAIFGCTTAFLLLLSAPTKAVDLDKCCALEDWILLNTDKRGIKSFYNLASAQKYRKANATHFVSYMSLQNASEPSEGGSFPNGYKSYLTNITADCDQPDFFAYNMFLGYDNYYANGNAKPLACWWKDVRGPNCYGGEQPIRIGTQIDNVRQMLCEGLPVSPLR